RAGRQVGQVLAARERAGVVAGHPRRRVRGDRTGRRRVLQRLELALDKAAEPGAVVALEGTQRLDGALQLLAAPRHLLSGLGDLHARLLLRDASARLGGLDALLVAGLQAL